MASILFSVGEICFIILPSYLIGISGENLRVEFLLLGTI